MTGSPAAIAGPELAINGGSPVRTKPWLDNFTLGDEEKRAAVAAIDSGYLSLFEGSHSAEPPFSFWGGPFVRRLETEWAARYGSPFAVSMNSATSALYASIGALGVGYGDEVIVSPYTMSACATCALVYGAIPVFADVDGATGCLDPESVRSRVTSRTRAIVVVHQFGIPADMDGLMAVAREHGLKVIEDCAQAHGARYRGRPVGTIGDIGVFSLNVNKTIQAGEGGVCLTSSETLRDRLALIRNHAEAVVGPMQHADLVNMIGFNYRLTEIGAAIGIEQLKKLDAFNEARIRYVRTLSEALRGYSFLRPAPHCSHADTPEQCPTCESTYYVYPLRFIAATSGGIGRTAFARALAAEGTPWSEGYVRPLYFQPLYQHRIAFKRGYPFAAPENQGAQMNYAAGACPTAERLHSTEMLINEYVRLPHGIDDIRDIAAAIGKIARATEH